jgi:hypothetical protein
MTDFQYGTGVGTPSYNQIIAFARRSGVAFSVSATTGGAHVNGSYHYSGNAVDMVASPGSMVQLAAWLYAYAPFELELIHSGGPGYFVKNGVKVTAAFYGATTVSQHYNHVHCAMTQVGITAAEQQGQNAIQGSAQLAAAQSAKETVAGTKVGGCLIPSALLVLTPAITIGSTLWMMHH